MREGFVGVVPIIGLWIAMTSARAVGRRRATALLLLFLAVCGAPRFAVPFLPVVFVIVAGPMAGVIAAGWH